MSNDPNADDGRGDHIEDRMLAMIARAEAGERVTEAERVLECEPADDDEWSFLPYPEAPAPATMGCIRAWWWHWLWRTDAEAYARWMAHRLRVATDAQLTRIIEGSRI